MKKNRFKFNNNFLRLKKIENFNKVDLFIFKNSIFNKSLRQKSLINLDKNKFFLSKTFLFCLITGRVRGTVKRFFISRHEFKSFIKTAKLAGIFKSNW